MDGVRQGDCLLFQVAVNAATQRLWRVTIQYEAVGTGEGQGCSGCPFVPRAVKEFTRENSEFNLHGSVLNLSLCGLEPGVEYRFRVVGTSELPAMPLVKHRRVRVAPVISLSPFNTRKVLDDIRLTGVLILLTPTLRRVNHALF